MRAIYGLAIAVLLLPSWVCSASQSFVLERGTVSLDLPTNWKAKNDLLGVPLTLIGPMTLGGRSVIHIVPVGVSGLSFDPEKLKLKEHEYRSGRLAWLGQFGGTAVRFLAYAPETWTGASEVHKVGYRYLLNKIEFIEQSYTVLCKGDLYMVQSLIRASSEKIDAVEVESILKSFKCEKGAS